MRTVVVTGGGAAGMIAAVFAARRGNRVILIEKNEKLGKKLYITGKGRCNLTNDCTPEEFLENVVSNAKFLSGAIRAFSPQNTQDFFEEIGLKLKTERGNRVFPLSEKASDVTKFLSKELEKEKVEIALSEKVEKIVYRNGRVSEVLTDKREIACDSVVICTGGLSYPATGSTGDGYLFARAAGHTIKEPKPALVGIETKENFARLQGLSLKNVALHAYLNGKSVFCETGEMLFTHFGISGPLVLSVSALVNRSAPEEVLFKLDLKPGLTEEQLYNRIERDFAEAKGKTVENGMVKLMPSRLIDFILARAADKNKRVSEISNAEKRKIVSVMKGFEIRMLRLRPIEEAVITAGGVNIKEVNPKSMESKLIQGLFFAGEVLDLDAFTGGFNLQIAFTTGYIAGNHA